MARWAPVLWSVTAAVLLVGVTIWALLGVDSTAGGGLGTKGRGLGGDKVGVGTNGGGLEGDHEGTGSGPGGTQPEGGGGGPESQPGSGGPAGPIATGGSPPPVITDPPGPAPDPPAPQAPIEPLPKPTVGFTTGDSPVEPRSPSPTPRTPVPPTGGSPGPAGVAGGVRGGQVAGARGDISFVLAWTYSHATQATAGGQPRGGPDIDMWVVDPNGERLSTSRDGRGLGPTSSQGRIDLDDQGAFGGMADGGGPERAFWPTGAAPKGSYQYGVMWFQGVGTANYTFKVYIGPKEVRAHRGTLDQTQRQQPLSLGTIEN